MNEPFKGGCACASTEAHPIDPAVREEVLRKLQAVEAGTDAPGPASASRLK
jgi:uncharacterized protein